jgi:hypothetical protein
MNQNRDEAVRLMMAGVIGCLWQVVLTCLMQPHLSDGIISGPAAHTRLCRTIRRADPSSAKSVAPQTPKLR